MVDIKPLSKNFEDEIKQAQTAEDLIDAIKPETIGKDGVPANSGQGQNVQSLPKEGRRLKAEKELKRWNGELKIIDAYAIICICIAFICIFATFNSNLSGAEKSFYCFVYGLIAVISYFLIKGYDWVRKLIIAGSYLNVALSVYNVILKPAMALTFVLPIVLSIIFIIFFSSKSIKRHF